MLSAGAVRLIYNNETPKNPMLQVIDVKALTNGKFRIMLSDGENFLMGMLSTKLTPLVATGEMCANSLISIGDYWVNPKKEMLVFEMN